METGAPHIPVLVQEVITYLDPRPGKVYVDATFGAGGHTKAILDYEPQCRVIAVDWDRVSLEQHGDPLKEIYDDRLHLVWGNFSIIDRLMAKEKVKKIDGVLADFGTSQMQIQDRAGFSLYRDSPLDMRMAPSYYQVTAQDVLAQKSEKELADIFWAYGQEKYGRAIARAIVYARQKKTIATTGDLVQVIEQLLGKKQGRIHPATRVFQALRLYVNHELDNITSFLPAAVRMLSVGGRFVCISFHSLEDVRVKQFFKEQEKEQVLHILTKRIVIPTDYEIHENPSSRSARLRAAERV